MAEEYLIQKETLDNIADAINAKTGKTEAMTPAQMVTEIAAIETGGGIPTLENISFISASAVANSGAVLELNMPQLTSMASSFRTPGFSKIAIHGGKPTSMQQAFYLGTQNPTLTTIDLTGVDFSECTTFYWCFENRNGLTQIIGELDFSSCTNVAEIFYNCGRLVYVRFKPNTLSIDIKISQGMYPPIFDADSLVSIANGLVAVSDTAKTITMNDSRKTICNSTLGTISQVVDSGATYDFFTMDENGTVTLMDFITNTKGWTVA